MKFARLLLTIYARCLQSINGSLDKSVLVIGVQFVIFLTIHHESITIHQKSSRKDKNNGLGIQILIRLTQSTLMHGNASQLQGRTLMHHISCHFSSVSWQPQHGTGKHTGVFTC